MAAKLKLVSADITQLESSRQHLEHMNARAAQAKVAAVKAEAEAASVRLARAHFRQACGRRNEILWIMRDRFPGGVPAERAGLFIDDLAAAFEWCFRSAVLMAGTRFAKGEREKAAERAISARLRRYLPSVDTSIIDAIAKEPPRQKKSEAIASNLDVTFDEFKRGNLRHIWPRHDEQAAAEMKDRRYKASLASREKKRRELWTPPRDKRITWFAQQIGVTRMTVHRWLTSGEFQKHLEKHCVRKNVTLSATLKDISVSISVTFLGNDRTRCDGSRGIKPRAYVTQAQSQSVDHPARDTAYGPDGPAASLALIPARIVQPDRYRAIIVPVVSGLRGDPIGTLLRVASSALRHHPIAANINTARAGLAAVSVQ